MALDNYDNLKASINKWMGRNDLSLINDDFIKMAEEAMYASSDGTGLRIREMEARSTASLSSGDRFLALPPDFIEQRRIKINFASQTDREIKFRVPSDFYVLPTAGEPEFFTVTSQFEFNKPADKDYTIEVQHYRKLTGLSDSNTTNAILTNHPMIYLYGCLWAANQYADEEERAEYYSGKFRQAIQGANSEDDWGRYGPAPAVRQRKGVV